MRPAPLTRPFAIVLTLAAAGACAHSPPAPDPYVDSGVASIRAWMNQIPRCPPSAEKMDGEIERDVGATAAAVRGLLTLTATPQCTLLACPGESACCNTCATRWVVVPDAQDGQGGQDGIDGTSREIAIQKSGEAQPMAASAKDCKLRPIREQIPKPEVVVSGWLEEEPAGQKKIIRASICVVERRPPPLPPTPQP